MTKTTKPERRWRTLWTLAGHFQHRRRGMRKCRCGRHTSGHEFKVRGRWVCRCCADEAVKA